MSDPAVTVVVAAYRRLRYLDRALTGALAQTYRDFEVLVCDDGASDEIAALVASLKDERLHYRRNPRRLGIALNHYSGYRAARGRYLANLDDDDIWEPEFLEALVAPLEADPSVVISFCDHTVIDADDQPLTRRANDYSRHFGRTRLEPGRQSDIVRLAVIDQSIPFAMGAVFRKSLLDGAEFPARIGGSYDYWLGYLAAKSGGAAFYVPRRLTRYRLHAASGTATRGAHNFRDLIYVQQRFLAAPELAGYRELLTNNLGVCYGRMALPYLKRGTWRRAGVLLRHGLGLMRRPRHKLGLLKNCLAHLVLDRAS
jgi:glycosyltransferase involved in cell wall biosynthesis